MNNTHNVYWIKHPDHVLNLELSVLQVIHVLLLHGDLTDFEFCRFASVTSCTSSGNLYTQSMDIIFNLYTLWKIYPVLWYLSLCCLIILASHPYQIPASKKFLFGLFFNINQRPPWRQRGNNKTIILYKAIIIISVPTTVFY